MINNTSSLQALKNIDLICFSHLRWDFVYQRPQHLLSRFSTCTRVFYIEEPKFHDAADTFQIKEVSKNLFIVVPYLQNGTAHDAIISKQKELIKDLFLMMEIQEYITWYYTPMSLSFSGHLTPKMIVYDCMDELSAFKFAPVELKEKEAQLIGKADLVFTGGYSIYEAKKTRHQNIYPFPSSIDKEHFSKAREIQNEPEDQAHIPHPRFGFYGVIDERFDIDMIEQAAKAKPDWHFILIGPVVKIDPATLPRFDNIHYLGGKSYNELPYYLSSWEVAMIPFALNESTRFISPTKTPEYLAAGIPVISTAIKDVVSPYAENKLVNIAATSEEFIKHGETILKQGKTQKWLTQVDAFLQGNSWDRTWSEMMKHIEHSLITTAPDSTKKTKQKIYV